MCVYLRAYISVCIVCMCVFARVCIMLTCMFHVCDREFMYSKFPGVYVFMF